jgi:ABC-2 type transport system ATP-binding protein
VAAAPTTADGVRKRFGRRGRWVLDGADLVVPPGAVTVVTGGNGSGKTTLLRIVAGASQPTRGRVLGRPAAVAYVPERLPAHGPMTAAEYLGHLGRIRRLPPAAVRERSAELFGLLGLAPGPDVPMSALSRGNAQKVAVAQAFLAPAGLLVLDEPDAGLDPPAAAVLAGLLRQATGRGAAVLVSAHQPDGAAVAGRGDHVHQLSGGRLRPAGTGTGPAGHPAAGPGAGPASAPGGASGAAGTGDRGPAAAPVLHLLLEAVGDAASVADLTAGTAARVLGHHPPYCRLAAPAGEADAVLLRALAAGWSLRGAGPA